MIPFIGGKVVKFTFGMAIGVTANQMIGQDALRDILADPTPIVTFVTEFLDSIRK